MNNSTWNDVWVTHSVSLTGVTLSEDDQQETTTLALQLAIVGALLFLAGVTNVLVIAAYIRKWRKSANLFLVVLAFSDIFNCIVVGMEFLMRLKLGHDEFRCIYFSIRQTLVYFGMLTSAFLVVCITWDRFTRIDRSRHARPTPRKCVLVIISSAVAAIIVSGPFTVANMAIEQSDGMDKCPYSTQDPHYRVTQQPGEKQANAATHITTTRLVNTIWEFNEGHNDPQSTILKDQESYFLIFHLIAAIQIIAAFIFVCIANVKIIIMVVRNGHKMSRHMSKGNGLDGQKELYEKGTNTPSDTDISEQSHVSVPMERAEIRRKLSALIAHQAANLDRYIKRRSSFILLSRSTNQYKVPSRTIVLLLIAIVLFMFNLPPLFLNVTYFVWPSVNVVLQTNSNILMSFLTHSNIIGFICNPLLYAFFNRGFLRHLRKACCCCDWKMCSSLRKPKINQKPIAVKNGSVTQLNPRVWYPTFTEIQRQTSYKTTAV